MLLCTLCVPLRSTWANLMQPWFPLFFRATARLDAFSRKICKGEVEARRAVNKYSQKYFTQKRLPSNKRGVGMLSVTDVSGSALPNDSSDVTLQQQQQREVACYKEEVLLKAAKSSHVSRWDHCSRSNSQAAGNTKAGHIFQNLFLWGNSTKYLIHKVGQNLLIQLSLSQLSECLIHSCKCNFVFSNKYSSSF